MWFQTLQLCLSCKWDKRHWLFLVRYTSTNRRLSAPTALSFCLDEFVTAVDKFMLEKVVEALLLSIYIYIFVFNAKWYSNETHTTKNLLYMQFQTQVTHWNSPRMPFNGDGGSNAWLKFFRVCTPKECGLELAARKNKFKFTEHKLMNGWRANDLFLVSHAYSQRSTPHLNLKSPRFDPDGFYTLLTHQLRFRQGGRGCFNFSR